MIDANNMDRLQTHFKEPELVKNVYTHWAPNYAVQVNINVCNSNTQSFEHCFQGT